MPSASQGYKPAKLVLTVHFILGFRKIKERVGWDPGQTWRAERESEGSQARGPSPAPRRNVWG